MTSLFTFCRLTDSSKKSGRRLVGDVHYESVSKIAGAITPVPGGVGPMTVSMLLRNTFENAKKCLTAEEVNSNTCAMRSSVGGTSVYRYAILSEGLTFVFFPVFEAIQIQATVGNVANDLGTISLN